MARRVLRVLCWIGVVFVISAGVVAAHDLEKTQVSIVFARDGSFVADVVNDPAWLALRRESVPGPFADRVVFWVDGREIRPESVELIGGATATNRLRGRVPLDAQTLRWYYGLVIDPYPLTIHRADGRIIVEEVQGNAWSRTIDLSGQFQARAINPRIVGFAIAAVLLLPVAFRLTTKFTNTRKTRNETLLFFFVPFVGFVLSCVSWFTAASS